jgi:hypothetical protein
MLWTILALGCIVLAFVGEIIDERILLGTLEGSSPRSRSTPSARCRS